MGRHTCADRLFFRKQPGTDPSGNQKDYGNTDNGMRDPHSDLYLEVQKKNTYQERPIAATGNQRGVSLCIIL